MDVLYGGRDQLPNDYLGSKLIHDIAGIPSWKDVLSFVLRQVYVGTSKYIPPWSFLVQHTRHSDWYSEKAPIGRVIEANSALYIALDRSGSMDWGAVNEEFTAPIRWDVARAAVTRLLEGAKGTVGLDVRLVVWSGTASAIERRGASESDLDDIITWLAGQSTQWNGTDFEVAVASAPAFFDGSGDKSRLCLFITDGEPNAGNTSAAASSLLGIEGIQSYAFNILLANTTYTAMMDNTPSDGVPVITSLTDDSMYNAIRYALGGGYFDMNPAHIIRACLTNRVWGLGYPDGDVDDVAFAYAADMLYAESLGLSLIWDTPIEIEEFIVTVLEHISANLYVEPSTGKWVLKLIRQDYNAAELPVYDGSVIERVENYTRRHLGELTNTVTLKYQLRRDVDFDQGGAILENLASGVGQMGVAADVPSSVTLHNIGLINMMGGEIVNQELNYPGISRPDVANAVAARELANLSAELSAATLVMSRVGHKLRPGSVFKLTWPEYGITEEIMRVTEIDTGTLTDGRLRVGVIQDLAGVGTAVYAEPSSSLWTDPIAKPVAPPHRQLLEAPYWHWVQRIGEGSAWADVEDDEARLIVCAAKPTDSTLDAGISTRISPAAYQHYGYGNFTPYALLAEDVGKTDVVFTVTAAQDIDKAVIGGYAYLGNEIVAVEAIDGNEVQVVRAVLDTIPQEHVAGIILWFAQGWERTDNQQYFEDDTADVKVTPRTGKGELSADLAPTDSLIMVRRMDRPYPPGNLKINGEVFPEEITGALALTWAHRHRKQQTAYFVSQSEGDIGPEPGTRYLLKIYGETGFLLRTVNTENNYYTYTPEAEEEDSGLGRPNTSLRFILRSLREEV